MPRGDGTGPAATGAMTGRGAGRCGGGQNGGKAKSGSGCDAIGRVMCNWFNASDLANRSPKENEGKLLTEQANVLKKQLDVVNRRLSEL